MGNVITAGNGQGPARIAAIAAGIPSTTPCLTVNKVCASGMKATALGASAIRLGEREVVVTGGMESMSSAPFLLENMRNGHKLGHTQTTDAMLKDGLWDSFNDFHMGTAAELCALKHNFTREDQDNFAIQSYQRAVAAQQAGEFVSEIVPVTVQVGRNTVTVDCDEHPGKCNVAKVPALRGAFALPTGATSQTVTAANASPISDGAAALVLCSGRWARQQGLQPMALIRGYDDAATAPEDFTVAPALAVPKALGRASLSVADVHSWELNEAFAVVGLANMKLLGLNADIVNVQGGSVALGHPLGSSGARILVTLIHGLRRRQQKIGCAAICNGGGGASAMVLEALSS